MTDPLPLEVDRADTVPLRLTGRHVAHVTDGLSIRSFLGGRFPRHRTPDDGSDLDAELLELSKPSPANA